jgi:hypothetical protein
MGDKIKVEDNDPGLFGRIVDSFIGTFTNTYSSDYKATVTDENGNTKVGEGNTKEEAIKNAYKD